MDAVPAGTQEDEVWLFHSIGSAVQPIFQELLALFLGHGELEQIPTCSVLLSVGAERVTVEGKVILCQVFFPADTWGEEHLL